MLAFAAHVVLAMCDSVPKGRAMLASRYVPVLLLAALTFGPLTAHAQSDDTVRIGGQTKKTRGTVLEATSGMYGDLQGIAGQNLKDIDALEGPMHLELGE